MKTALYAIWTYLKQTDKLLWLYCLLLSGTSLCLLHSICENGFVAGNKIFYVQLAAILLGIAVAVFLSKVDYHTMAALWKLYVPVTLLLTLLTFTPLGVMREGTDDKAWLSLGIIDLQPSELLKLAFVFTFAMHLSHVYERLNTLKNILLLCLHGAIPVLLILAQGDYGSAIIFLCIFIFMLFAAGLSWKFIAAGLAAAGVGLPLFYFFVLSEHHRIRFRIAMNPELDPMGAGFQQVQGKIGLGSGELFGRGLFNNNLPDTIPEVYNDFIFAYVGQTLGFVGCVAVAFLLVMLCVKILMTGRASNDHLGCFICVGIFTIFIVQSVINIGMVLCVMPVIGVTLPFVSYGGSSVVTMYIAAGIVLSVHINGTKKTTFDY